MRSEIMLKRIKEKYENEKNVDVSIKIRGIPLSFKITKEINILTKIGMVSTALDIATVEDTDFQTFDRNIANKILEFLIIKECTNIEVFGDEETEETIENIFEFLDILGENGIKSILRIINETLNIKNLYKELSYMLENNIKEFYEIRRFKNSSISRIINLLSNIDEGGLELLKELEPKLNKVLDKIDDKEKE